ncbi:MAG: sulfotransferase domain-containing protein [Cyanobacteria bacterium J06635_15]
MIDFLGIGAQKAATTWLCKNLGVHPHICFPAGKEIHFWDHQYPAKGVEHWLNLFPANAEPIKQGEITPAYGTLSLGKIQQIFAVAPNLRLFYSIRNPIERAWSSAQMALRRAEMLEHEASDQWFIDHFLSKGSRSRSDYLGTIARWTGVFPSHSLLLIFYDDIFTNPKQVLKHVSEHIGVDSGFWNTRSEETLKLIIRPSLGVPFSYPPNQAASIVSSIRSSLRAFLIDLYRSDIEKMSNYFQRDLSHWLQESNAKTSV